MEGRVPEVVFQNDISQATLEIVKDHRMGQSPVYELYIIVMHHYKPNSIPNLWEYSSMSFIS